MFSKPKWEGEREYHINESSRIIDLWIVGESVFLKVRKGGLGRVHIIYVFSTQANDGSS